ncbi:hypothetical protein OHA37_38565 [Streptomyces sp. NBC_00335]|uniref:hypothetical protein n=1 Tax=unclassified Streptomyces TaxID=2593676 RepID=UPI002259E431|nr:MULTISPECIES: hypothetical protein [unclassified Streptomyces]MCX5409747.1 hypothetical protein [Streptomyces sp. NBC_00086]
MAQVVLVHGIFNYVRGATPQEAALEAAAQCRTELAAGLAKAGLAGAADPDLAMAYYADLLRPGLPDEAQADEEGQEEDGFEKLTAREREDAAEWLVTAGAPVPEQVQNIGLAPLRQLLGWLVDDRKGPMGRRLRDRTVRRLERMMLAMLREVEAYTTWSERRRLVQERVAQTIQREQPKVIVAHSLGSVVAYETLHAHPELRVRQLVTLGSPLRLPSLARRLEPGLRAGRGARPAGVEHWTNIADVGDLVAIPPKLSEVFPVDQDEVFDNGLDFHGLGSYLANGLTGLAVVPYLS